MTDENIQPSTPEIMPARKSLWQRLSLVWLVPVGALAVSLWVVFTTYNDRGPVIEIAFPSASGVKAGETELRYRDVAVGLVEDVRFSEGLDDVLVTVRLEKNVARFVDADAQFWVVSPQVSAQGVSGLDTVLSGVYIEGNWNTTVDAPAASFRGLDRPPLIRSGQEGIAITLRSSNVEGLSEGTPILYRGITVGKVANLRLSDDGVAVIADAFIRAPEDRLITTATRFWDTSGFTFSFGASGAQLSVSSLASLVAGGVAFDTIVSGGEAVGDQETFQLFADENTARNSVFTDGGEGPKLDLAVVFEGSVSGLAVGAAVEFQGINVGRVTAITGVVDEERFGDNAVRLLATVSLRLSKLGLSASSTPQQALDFLEAAVDRGVRAQLQNASILTGGLKVALLVPDFYGPLLPEDIDRTADPYPIFPSVQANISDFNDTAEGVFNRINELPVEELLGSAINVMDSVNRLLNDEGTTGTPAEVLALISDMRSLVGSGPVQALPDQAGAVMASLEGSVASFERLLLSIEEQDAVKRLVAALDAAEQAADAVSLAVSDVDTLVTDLQAVSRSADALLITANGLPLDALIAQATTVLNSADSLFTDPATLALPNELRTTVAQARGVIEDLRTSGVIEQVSTTLTATEKAIGDVATALMPVIESADAGLAGVPALITELEGVAQDARALIVTANALPLNDLVTRAGGVITSANALLNDAATRALPGQVGAAIEAARGTLDDLRASGVIDAADAALTQASDAVTRITDALMPVLNTAQSAMISLDAAAIDLPRLTARADAIAAEIETLVGSAGEIPLDQLAERARVLIDSANTLIGSADTRAVPGALNAALAQIEGVLNDMRNGGLIDNANKTLVATENAASAVARATEDLPGLVNRMNRLLAEAEKVVGGYDANGQLGSEAKSTLRDIRAAAKSVSTLARSIERSPNSLLFGR
ncbi:PqiB family protein [Oceaniglobus ichthyenteri]|uniref:PqiB family protein n=1 Tax=Oceaniglobus ichthyenteri TaxID=2136177 RepID=UPI000D332363|nr:MlaD family protein [Oceaniglobus ichthyenteri]